MRTNLFALFALVMFLLLRQSCTGMSDLNMLLQLLQTLESPATMPADQGREVNDGIRRSRREDDLILDAFSSSRSAQDHPRTLLLARDLDGQDLVFRDDPERDVGGDTKGVREIPDLGRSGLVQSDVHAVQDLDEDFDLGGVIVREQDRVLGKRGGVWSIC